MARRTDVDWETIEKEYRSGQLSVREISRRHDITDTAIRKRAKVEGWTRDLSQKIRDEVRRKLVRSAVCKPDISEKEIIAEATERGVQVITSHRNDIAKLQALEQRLLEELGDQDKPPQKVHVSAFQGEVTLTPLRITVTERASALQSLAAVQHKRIQLQRQAFNLGEEDREKDDAMVTLYLQGCDGAQIQVNAGNKILSVKED